jgi:hypothetical protein
MCLVNVDGPNVCVISITTSDRCLSVVEFYVFDADLRLQYHGQFDSSRPSNNLPVTGRLLMDVLALHRAFTLHCGAFLNSLTIGNALGVLEIQSGEQG